MDITKLEATINLIKTPAKGILAADESLSTIKKRFDAIHVENTEENRRAYRELLFTTPELEKYISGIILFDETLRQKTKEGTPFPEVLNKKGIAPGIKVDGGLIPLVNGQDEKTTQGLDGLPERLMEYQKLGARFTKWRVIYKISDNTPSRLAIKTNSELLGRYAAIAQSCDLVPIVEPEVLIDGDHSIEKCAEITERVLHSVFHTLHRHRVVLELIILKPSMVIAGKTVTPRPAIELVAKETVKILRRTVPAAVPTINFLSGGQDEQTATAHLNAMYQLAVQPWYLSFSYGRALQESCLKTWAGKAENVKAAQAMLQKRARLNSLATEGKYSVGLEK